MRLVGLYYRTAAEEFFPAMGAIQMPMLGWTKVSKLAPAPICPRFVSEKGSLAAIGRDGGFLRAVSKLHARRERACVRSHALLERAETRKGELRRFEVTRANR